MRLMPYFYAILFVSCFGILTTVRNLYEQYPLVYLLCVATMITSLLCIISDRKDLVEHLQISGEAVQNVGSIYNAEKMVLKDLDVTGKLTICNGKVVIENGNVTVDGAVKGNTLYSNGWIHANNEIRSVAGQLILKDWTQNAGDGHLRMSAGGDQKFTIHNRTLAPDWGVWDKDVGNYRDAFVRRGDKIMLRSISSNCTATARSKSDAMACYDGEGWNSYGDQGVWEVKVV